MKRWQIGYKRGRQHITSPDPLYDQKIDAIKEARRQAEAKPEQVVLLFGDETTIYRQPEVGLAYEQRGAGGRYQLLAERSYSRNSKHRIVGVLDAVKGRVLFAGGSKVGVKVLCQFLKQLRQAYEEGVRIVLVWDNWLVHKHPLVMAAAEASRIEMMFLPTYAPWTNPIEKLWRKLKQEIISMHRFSDRWADLKQEISRFLSGYDRPSPDLLRYVGLSLPD